MSETVVFIIGSIIWAITVAGVVIAGGYLLGNPRAQEKRRARAAAQDRGLIAAANPPTSIGPRSRV